MAQCTCGNQDLEYKSGISKKTGKKWQGYKCAPCNLMMGMDGVPWGAKPTNIGGPAKQFSVPPSNSIDKKLDKILSILEANLGKANILHKEFKQNEETEEEPF